MTTWTHFATVPFLPESAVAVNNYGGTELESLVASVWDATRLRGLSYII